MVRSFRRLVSVGVVFSLLVTSFAWAEPDGMVVPVPKTTAELSQLSDQFTEEQAPVLTEGTRKWAEDQELLVPSLLQAAERLAKEAKRIEQTRGVAMLDDMIKKNQFIMVDPQYGFSMEYRIIDGHRMPRFLIDDEVYILVDENLIPRDSKHLKQYIARTHHESGAGRPKINAKTGAQEKTIFGNKKTTAGRNLTVLYLNDDVTHVEKNPKPKPTQWHWWSQYFVSKYKSPTINDFTMAFVTGVALQSSLTLAMSYMKHKFLDVDFTMLPTYFTMAYGLGIGTFYSLYKNWTTNSGSRTTRILKQQVVSTFYAVGLVMGVTSGDWNDKTAAVSLFTTEGRSKDVSILANGIMNNTVKDFANQVPRLREKTRESAGLIKFRVPIGLENKTTYVHKDGARVRSSELHEQHVVYDDFGNEKHLVRYEDGVWHEVNEEERIGFKYANVEWSKANLENQLLYLIPWTVNVVSLMTLASTDWFKIPGTDITIPILQLATIPIYMKWSKWYARKLADRAKKDPDMTVRAAELEQIAQANENAWNNTFGMELKELPDKVTWFVKSTANAALEFGKSAVRACRYLLGDRDTSN